MATELGDLGDFFDPGLAFRALGKRYVVPLPSGELGVWCQLMDKAARSLKFATTSEEVAAAVDRINALPPMKDDDLTLPQRVLGLVHAELIADGVPHHFIEFAGALAYTWIVHGEEAAEQFYKVGGRRPEEKRPANRAARRAAKKTTGGSRTAAVARTPRAASSSGTRSRTTSAAPKKAAAKKRA